MDIISGENDRDGEGVCREGWEEEVGVYSVWVGQTSFGMGFGEDLLFQLVIIFPRMSQVREENTVLLCFEIGTTPSTNIFKPFFFIYGEGDAGCLHLCRTVPVPPGHRTVSLAGTRGRQGREQP